MLLKTDLKHISECQGVVYLRLAIHLPWSPTSVVHVLRPWLQAADSFADKQPQSWCCWFGGFGPFQTPAFHVELQGNLLDSSQKIGTQHGPTKSQRRDEG